MRDLSGAPFGLPPFAGHVRVPCWAIRAGSIPELEPARPGLPLWMAIYSVNLGRADPCYCQEETLAATVGIDRSDGGAEPVRYLFSGFAVWA